MASCLRAAFWAAALCSWIRAGYGPHGWQELFNILKDSLRFREKQINHLFLSILLSSICAKRALKTNICNSFSGFQTTFPSSNRCHALSTHDLLHYSGVRSLLQNLSNLNIAYGAWFMMTWVNVTFFVCLRCMKVCHTTTGSHLLYCVQLLHEISTQDFIRKWTLCSTVFFKLPANVSVLRMSKGRWVKQ